MVSKRFSKMIFMFVFLVLIASILGESIPTPPNPSGNTPSVSMIQSDSELLGNSTSPIQSNTNPSSSAQPTQPGQYNNNSIHPPYLRQQRSLCRTTNAVTQINSSFLGPVYQQPSQSTTSPCHNQNNTSTPSPVHTTQPGQDNNPIPPPYLRHPVPPSSPLNPSNSNPLIHVCHQSSRLPCHSHNNTYLSSPAPPSQSGQNNLISPRHQRHPVSPSSEGQTSNLIPVYQQPSQSTTRVPWYRGNEFYAIERAPHGLPPNEFHRMDRLSICVLNYFFAWGLSYASERPNLSTSIYIQCFLNQAAFSLFLLANAVFPRTHPVLAFIIDRLSFLLIVISGYLASLPMFPPYVALTMFLVVAIVYIFSRFRG